MKQFIVMASLLMLFSHVNADVDPQYVGGEVCESCHQQQVKLWQGSHHDLAMQHADNKTVLADFSGVSFTQHGITSRFYKKNDKFMVRTDGPDGKLQDYEIKYTFGVTPLQQYLVELDKGRLQALTIAWDTRKKTEGGQRWFHLYPDTTITHHDELHWTRSNFNWNGMCAECHSTNLKKSYDSSSDSFKTSWSEIDVSCEACHGPASDHVVWAEKKSGWEKFDGSKGLITQLDERKDVSWEINKKTGSASRGQAKNSDKEIEICAQCHSRRSAITDDYLPGETFTDHYMPRLLDEDMYFSDGQVQEEVYVYGSFLQSKMYHKGVTCSDCHEPHSLELRAEGNAVCLQCHSAEKFDSKDHHHHKAGSEGASCAECHMPSRTYMVVDPRHDHSFRIPRPDLSVELGALNACNNCHKNKDALWAVSSMKQWPGNKTENSKKGYQQFASALDAGRRGSADAGKQLLATINDIETPDIARASALSLMPAYFDRSSINILKTGLQDENALLRIAAVGALETLPARYKVQLAYPMLSDKSRAVRIESARILASLSLGELPAEQRKVIDSATAEYLKSQQVNADRPEAQMNLGNYYVARHEYKKAEAAYDKAIRLDSSFTAARINLADLYRLQGDNSAALKVLLKAKKLSPDNAGVHHALGLTFVRLKQNDKAIDELETAATLSPGNVTYGYVYAVALNSASEHERALKVIRQLHDRFPDDRGVLTALVAFYRDAGDEFATAIYMKKLQRLEEAQ